MASLYMAWAFRSSSTAILNILKSFSTFSGSFSFMSRPPTRVPVPYSLTCESLWQTTPRRAVVAVVPMRPLRAPLGRKPRHIYNQTDLSGWHLELLCSTAPVGG